MNVNSLFSKFTPNLFWDVETKDMDMEQYPAFIISRVLEYGRWEDWKIIVNYYGLQRIVDVCKHLRTLDPVCLSYICTISHTNPKDYRCWHIRQSSPTHWNS